MNSYDVRIWAIREHAGRDRKTGKARSTYRVRWSVAGVEFGKSYQTRAMAESFRSRLIVAQREGVAFDKPTGLPEPMAREAKSRTWYEHAVAFVDMKWPRASGKHRRSIADALATVTPAFMATERGFRRTRRFGGLSTPGRSTRRPGTRTHRPTSWRPRCGGWPRTR